MEKIKRLFILSDTHFGIRSNSLEWLNIQKTYFEDFFIPYISSYVFPFIFNWDDLPALIYCFPRIPCLICSFCLHPLHKSLPYFCYPGHARLQFKYFLTRSWNWIGFWLCRPCSSRGYWDRYLLFTFTKNLRFKIGFLKVL